MTFNLGWNFFNAREVYFASNFSFGYVQADQSSKLMNFISLLQQFVEQEQRANSPDSTDKVSQRYSLSIFNEMLKCQYMYCFWNNFFN